MVATYTAVTQTSSKTSGSTLATSSVSFALGSKAIVGLGYDDAQGHPTSVKWGNKDLQNKPNAATRNPGTYDIAMSVWILPRVKRSSAHVITATWAGNIVERAMLVGQINDKNRIDVASGNNDGTATAAPVTGLTATLNTATDFAVAYFVSEGPQNNDNAGTAQIKDAGTFTNATGTHRIGTNGTPPVSNVTIQAAFLQLTSTTATEGRLQSATSRKFTSAIITTEEILESAMLSDLGAERSLNMKEQGDVETNVLAWAQTGANQTTVKTWFPSTEQDIDIKAMMRTVGLSFMRISKDV